MKKLLKSQLEDYQSQYDVLEHECLHLMEKGLPFEEKAKKASGLKRLIDYTKEQLNNHE